MSDDPTGHTTDSVTDSLPDAGLAVEQGERVAELKHRRPSRWMHWINFPLLTIMIWSGLRIYWADLRDPFGFGVGIVGWHWFDFLPDFINGPLGLERKLAAGMAFHFTFGWLFAINGVAYGLYTWLSGEWRHLLPDRRSPEDAVAVVKHDLFIRGEPLPPQGRYNGAQRLSYTLIIGLGAVAILTGLAIYKPTQLNILTAVFGGYEMARTIHFVVTMAFLAFFVVHILQVARAGWANFASMVSGYELMKPASGYELMKPASGSELPGPEVAAPTGPVISESHYRSRSRRSFLTGGATVVAGLAGWRWLRARPEDNRAIDVLRRGHEANETLWRALSRDAATAPTFDRSESSMIRVNGRHGLRDEIDLATWELTVLGPDGSTLGTNTMEDIRALPKYEMTVEHKCVEGWSHIVTWGGARFSDFAMLYADRLGLEMTEFVSLETPDSGYYVGLDMPSMLNQQMLLAYELEGRPLTQEHGAPVRLATPNKYGIKAIKRIGTIQFTNRQPTDYWFERGYDWYAQL